MTPLAVTDYTLVTALGAGRDATLQALRDGRSGLKYRGFETARHESWLGLVDGLDDIAWPDSLAASDCRNNRLAALGLAADGFIDSVARARQRFGADRVGVFLGTSTSGILETEQAYRRRDPASGALPPDLHYAETHNTYSVARYVRAVLNLQGPACVVSTACSSSAKVFGQAARLIELGLIDAAVVGGVDSLCLTTVYGFQALELVSPEICRPWDARRKGLSLGEAAAFALLERDALSPMAWLLGCGESSDGHHMSSPHPEGLGAVMAMQQALAQAGRSAAEVAYVNQHGTGTPGNDAAEDRAMCSVFGTGTPCSSSKGYTGHTLGAAGGVEAAISMLALRHGLLPAGLNVEQVDPALHCHYLLQTRQVAVDLVLSNSFGFGGSNASLLFGAVR